MDFRPTIAPWVGTKASASTFAANSPMDDDCSAAKMPARSPVNTPCSEQQSLYSCTGSTPTREAAKKPFSTFSTVPLILAFPV